MELFFFLLIQLQYDVHCILLRYTYSTVIIHTIGFTTKIQHKYCITNYITERQLKAGIQKDFVECSVLGAVDFIRLHQDL